MATEMAEVRHIDTGDMMKVKQVLSDASIMALEEADYPVEFFMENVKLGLSALSIAFAMVAQFYPMPFPESRPLLAVCCFAYFAFSGILQLIMTFVDGDIIARLKPKMEITKSDQLILLRGDLPRFEESFKLALVLDEVGAEKVEQDFYVGHYFDREGNFAEDLFVDAVQDLVRRVEEHCSKKKD